MSCLKVSWVFCWVVSWHEILSLAQQCFVVSLMVFLMPTYLSEIVFGCSIPCACVFVIACLHVCVCKIVRLAPLWYCVDPDLTAVCRWCKAFPDPVCWKRSRKSPPCAHNAHSITTYRITSCVAMLHISWQLLGVFCAGVQDTLPLVKLNIGVGHAWPAKVVLPPVATWPVTPVLEQWSGLARKCEYSMTEGRRCWSWVSCFVFRGI